MAQIQGTSCNLQPEIANRQHGFGGSTAVSRDLSGDRDDVWGFVLLLFKIDTQAISIDD